MAGRRRRGRELMASPGTARSAYRAARRAWPLALALYRRWETLPPAEKERYRRIARDNARRAQGAAAAGVGRGRRLASDAWNSRVRRG